MRLNGPAALGLARSLVIYYAFPGRRRALRSLYGQFVNAGDVVFDIGAHVGNRSRVLAGLGARVVAVEPQPGFAEFLSLVLPKRSHLVRAAVGAQEGQARLRISSRHPTVSTLSTRWIDAVGGTQGFRGVRWDRSVEVPVVTLDGLIARFGHPTFCKIDVEGMEAEILQGLSAPIALLAFEYVPAAMEIAVASVHRLGALGRYRYNVVIGEDHRFVHRSWLDAEALLDRLAGIGPEEREGEIYARLEAGPLNAGG